MNYCEFELSVPIYDLSQEDEGDCVEMRELFALLEIATPGTTLASLYHCGDLLLFLSEKDEQSFIAVDMFAQPTDQMNTVVVTVRAPFNLKDDVYTLMKSLRAAAEVFSALLHGNLGRAGSLAPDKFPRVVTDHDFEAVQHIQVFRGGSVVYTSHLAH
jgi:hypothetical protein